MRNAPGKRAVQTTPATIVCGHCSTKARMPIVFTHSTSESVRGARAGGRGETLWEILCCPMCSMLQLRIGRSSPDDVEPFRWEVAYPAMRRVPRGLPADVARAYEAAALMQTVDGEAYAVLLGTVLEIVCQQQDAWGQNLLYRLRDLATRSLIPATLAEAAQGIGAFRSPIAPARASDLTAADIPLLELLCEAVLTYVYVGPALAAAASRVTLGAR